MMKLSNHPKDTGSYSFIHKEIEEVINQARWMKSVTIKHKYAWEERNEI